MKGLSGSKHNPHRTYSQFDFTQRREYSFLQAGNMSIACGSPTGLAANNREQTLPILNHLAIPLRSLHCWLRWRCHRLSIRSKNFFRTLVLLLMK